MDSLILALPEFGNVGVFMVFMFVLFATMGLHQYNGGIYNVCRLTRAPIEISQGVWIWEADLTIKRVCSKSGNGNF